MITVTRTLKLSYLWIDSLCIIQDSPSDWEKEASLMGSVYSFSHLTICVSSSPNPSTLFLRPRESDWLPKSFSFPVSPGISVPIQARKCHLLAAPLEQRLYEPPFTSSWAT
ncbi:uncharacterized protein BCR38DRAFT_448054 [Pseudomassariella vexata]|uniref:Heterokaryon incompatibility domain-containing protein n=1 Tax=Pseudomassariella vexata TaxID=1141098 RepID=A0A1Y2DFQ1_9PEZI|nr:uncharacterized protein BCR38DRAFT_448054 [Pseudomassariella vexata]ORY58112.1 hypothetical protein BCR38DRAFT_448054 [Pseudomassariella vexata]